MGEAVLHYQRALVNTQPHTVAVKHQRLRASANRSRSARRSSLPTVAGPDFSDESPHDDDYIGEGDPEVDPPPLTLRTPCELLVGVVPRRVGTLYDPALRGR